MLVPLLFVYSEEMEVDQCMGWFWLLMMIFGGKSNQR